jgi:hypothetical protein
MFKLASVFSLAALASRAIAETGTSGGYCMRFLFHQKVLFANKP